MSPYELLDVGIAAGTRVDVQWGLFVTVHLAVLGGIAYVERPLRLPEKVVAMAIYLTFATVSYRATRFHMSLLQAAYRDVAEVTAGSHMSSLNTVQWIAQDLQSGRFEFANYFVAAAHIVMALLVVLALIFDVEFSTRLSEKG